ncbi:MAG TPA: DUF2079 domain-containing protein [Candidatus Baltobacteraceae bacterium]|nr:DUF2079 domain-containing protein [Candidatus Baltobacteraceae bacterium]
MRDRFPWVVAFVYATLFAALGSLRYAIHRNFVDFGIFAQTSASAFGCFCNTIEGSHWAFHFSPILYFAGAVLSVWRSPFALIALQAIACALTVPPIYAMVATRGDRTVARWSAVVVALYPALAGLTFGDFHENGFAPAAVAWMLWAFDAGLLVPTLLASAIAIAVKEDQAIFVGVAGALGAWRFRGTMAGRRAMLVALLGFAVAWNFFHVVQPHAAINPAWSPTRFYAWTLEDIRALLPGGLLERAGFVVLAFLPLLFVPFRSRMMWLAAAPLAEVLLSRMPTTFTLGSHYAGAWIGYVLVAFAFAIRRLPPERARRVLYGCVALCCLELIVANPMHPRVNLHAPLARDRALDRVLATIPSNAEIATQEEAYTHLALRDPNATLLPERAATPLRAEFVLVDRDYPDSPRLQEYGAALDALVAGGAYRLVSREGGIALYRSTASAAAIP